MKAGRLRLKERRPFRSGPRAAQVIAIAVEMLQGDIAFGGGRASAEIESERVVAFDDRLGGDSSPPPDLAGVSKGETAVTIRMRGAGFSWCVFSLCRQWHSTPRLWLEKITARLGQLQICVSFNCVISAMASRYRV